MSEPANPLLVHAVIQRDGVAALGSSDLGQLGVEERATRPAIISCLADAANMLTLAGLSCSGAAIFAALRGSFHLAGLFMLGAYLADLFDGPIARATKHRSEKLKGFGASLDSLADLVGCGVAPSVVLLVYAGSDPWIVGAAAALLGSTAVRLAYFDNYGLDESGRYTGIPTDFVILFFSALLLLEGSVPASTYAGLLTVTAVGAAILMVSAVRVPKLAGRWYIGLPVVALAVAIGHCVRLTS